jgi:hypothetical protein
VPIGASALVKGEGRTQVQFHQPELGRRGCHCSGECSRTPAVWHAEDHDAKPVRSRPTIHRGGIQPVRKTLITQSRLVADLSGIGVGEGPGVMVHTKMSTIGWVVGSVPLGLRPPGGTRSDGSERTDRMTAMRVEDTAHVRGSVSRNAGTATMHRTLES